MRPIPLTDANVEDALRRFGGVATVPQLVKVLGAPSKSSIYRKLREMDTLSSYTQKGTVPRPPR